MSEQVERREGVIYIAKNTVNGKRYIGKTGREFEVRVREHEYDARNKARTPFSKAIRKHGIESFLFTILEYCDVSNIDDREIYWIAVYKTKKPNGYNLTDGGDGALGVSRPDVAALNKAKIGDKNPMFGKRYTEEERKKFSQPGEKNARYGAIVSEETRRKISEGARAAMKDPAVKAKLMEGIRRRESNPEFIKQRLKDRNRPEIRKASSDRMKAIWAARKSAQ